MKLSGIVELPSLYLKFFPINIYSTCIGDGFKCIELSIQSDMGWLHSANDQLWLELVVITDYNYPIPVYSEVLLYTVQLNNIYSDTNSFSHPYTELPLV